MGLILQLQDEAVWKRFYEYRKARHLPKAEARELLSFMEEKRYLPVVERMLSGERFPLPRRAVISKQGSSKKRVVYTYPPDENRVLKLLTYLMLRKYDSLYAPGLYSFRPGRSAKDAVLRLTKKRDIASMYSYKADISNYFNSVDIPLLLPMMDEALSGDPGLCGFLSALLREPNVLESGKELTEQKGIMAGTPIAAFLANLFLKELDAHFAALSLPYCRYSDDIIVFAPTREELETQILFIKRFLAEKKLAINPDKEYRTVPGEKWTFLGFSFENGAVDIAPASVMKLKKKMRRKARALSRWRDKKGVSGERAAKAFIKALNRKLYEYTDENDLTWARWFFPVISTVGSLRELDRYAEDCVRFIASGTRTKKRYDFRYSDIKALGYRSLVHEYYRELTEAEKHGAEKDEGAV